MLTRSHCDTSGVSVLLAPLQFTAKFQNINVSWAGTEGGNYEIRERESFCCVKTSCR